MSDKQSNQDAICRFLGFLGLARRAGKTVCGTPMICEEIARPKKLPLVLYSEGASPGTEKKLKSKCAFYGVPLLSIPVGTEELAHALGKTGALAAVGITDAGFAAAIRQKLTALSAADHAPQTLPEGDRNLTGKEASAPRKS